MAYLSISLDIARVRALIFFFFFLSRRHRPRWFFFMLLKFLKYFQCVLYDFYEDEENYMIKKINTYKYK
jgi:hypothetical protein